MPKRFAEVVTCHHCSDFLPTKGVFWGHRKNEERSLISCNSRKINKCNPAKKEQVSLVHVKHLFFVYISNVFPVNVTDEAI